MLKNVWCRLVTIFWSCLWITRRKKKQNSDKYCLYYYYFIIIILSPVLLSGSWQIIVKSVSILFDPKVNNSFPMQIFCYLPPLFIKGENLVAMNFNGNFKKTQTDTDIKMWFPSTVSLLLFYLYGKRSIACHGVIGYNMNV